ncbi:HAD family hydrolase [Alginatibacterium sediminis]|uniref:HAD family hydrolase n=1 Tax=Alginatibacterium sediminis TaxID=2164068 RepID=A0A420EBS1_9ALTE|nr:HAD-IA family hydrolase [Alginatibacterium sediminis]RKF18125.1 HAD family hydrolase [Alginatibacterium sediminis]
MMRCVLFDLDGTLLDTAPDLMAAANHVLQDHSFDPISLAKAQQLASHGAVGLLNEGFGSDITRFNLPQLRQQLLDYYAQNLAIHTQFYPGIEAALQWLNESGIAWGVVTNKPFYLADPLLDHYPSFASCQILLGGDSLEQKKPHPMPLYVACEHLQANPSESIYVGDAQRDIEAGNRADMFSLQANWGYLSPLERQQNWEPDHVLELSSQLIHFLKSHFDNHAAT